jgi:O-methyltransferase involved in polyketide biosynthesis
MNAYPDEDRAAFALETLAHTSEGGTDEYAIADGLLRNLPADEVRRIFGQLLDAYANVRMFVELDDKAEAQKHREAAEVIARAAVAADKTAATGEVLGWAAGYYDNRRAPFTVVRADDLTPRR